MTSPSHDQPALEPDLARRRASQAALERARELASERAWLQEILIQLEADERALANDLGAVRGECQELESELAGSAERVRTLDHEIVATEDAIFAKEHELESARHRMARASNSALGLERELHAYRGQISAAEQGFADVHERLLRLKHKLQHLAGDDFSKG